MDVSYLFKCSKYSFSELGTVWKEACVLEFNTMRPNREEGLTVNLEVGGGKGSSERLQEKRQQVA